VSGGEPKIGRRVGLPRRSLDILNRLYIPAAVSHPSRNTTRIFDLWNRVGTRPGTVTMKDFRNMSNAARGGFERDLAPTRREPSGRLIQPFDSAF